MPNETWEELLRKAESEGSIEGADSFEPPAPGRYSFVVIRSKHQQSKGGKDQISTLCKVLDEGSEKGKTIFNNFTLSPENPKALNIYFRELAVLGANKEFFGTRPTQEQIAKKLENAVFSGEVYINDGYTNMKNLRTATEEARQAALDLQSGAPNVASVATTSGVPSVATAASPAPSPAPAPPAQAPAPAPAAPPAPPAPAAAPQPAGSALPPPPPPPSF